MRIKSFHNEKRDKYYFRIFNSNEDQVLRSESYTSKAARDNGIKSFKTNAPIAERYERLDASDGKFHFNMKAANHEVIATSLMFDSEKERENVIAEIIAYASAGKTKAQPVVVKSSPNEGDSKEQDDYMAWDFYQNSGTDTTSGFDRFQKGDNNFYYFSFKSDDGKVLLISQGYTAESGRDNGIASVEKNSKEEKRYATHTSDNGKFYFTLKAGNHQEIARSVDFDSEGEMKRAMGIVINGGGTMVVAEVVKAAAPASSKRDGMDDYRTFGFYKNSGTDVQNGWDRFYSEKHNEYYFSYKQDGEPIIISEGYTTEAARENGITSVERNWSIEKRYKHHETAGGRYYYTLRAGNHQEIARSKWYSSAADRDGGTTWFLTGRIRDVSAEVIKSSIVSEEVVKATPPPVEKIVEKVIEKVVETPKEKEDDYLPCKEYEGHEVNDKVNGVAFFKHENGQFYFVVYKEDGSVRLRSEGFGSAQDRDSELSGMLKNLDNPEMYETVTRGIYSIHMLKDKTGREVGRSCLEKEVEEVIAPPVVEVAAVAATVVSEKVVTPPKVEAPKEKEDDYLPCKAYEGHEVNDKVNGVAFFKHENGQFYFVVYKKDGSVRLRSEGFTSAKDRDSELSGLLKNIDNPEMYETIKRGKYSIHMLRDKTGREVGRSCLEKEVEEVIAPPVVEVAAVAATVVSEKVVAPPKVEAPKEKEDDYLPCKAYEGHEVNDKVNGVAFFKHENGQFYFVVYKKDGSVRLRSEGFTTAQNRDSELSGLLKNLDNPEMYETIKRGRYSIHMLKDKTGREVGRSCLEKEVTKIAAPPVVEVAAVAATVVSSTKKVVEPPKEKEDDYLPCKAYEGHNVSDKVNRIAFFKKDNQYYFVAYKEDGSVRLRSEGFATTKNRDSELSGLLKNIDNSEMYETLSKGKYRIHILKDHTGREVGRSCLETVVEKVTPPPVVKVAAAAVAATVVSSAEDKEDDYLPCKDYEGHKISDKKNNVAFFKKGGQYYFVIYKADGTVRLRSEGFKNARNRDSELSGALKNLNNADNYETLTRGKYALHILKDNTGREVGRSCLETESNPIAVPVVVAAAAAAAVVIPPAPIKVEKEVIKPKKKKKKKKVVAAAAPAKAATPVVAKKAAVVTTAATAAGTTAAASGGGGFNWKMLLPLLLLIPLFMWWKGCGGCGETARTAVIPPKKEVSKVIPPVKIDTVEKKEVAPTPAPVVCNCTGSKNAIFNIPTNRTPKSLSRLGTNPEFGNSHGLDGAGFYNKLKNAHKSSQRDKRFLDNLFKAMGYTNGFADANAGLFSEVRLTAGTTGNMGHSKKHRTTYSTLNTKGKDLLAFRIKGANGCDIHFMKTCGNHFFFCSN